MLVKIFFCYAHEDEPFLKKLKMHLRPLQRAGFIDVWYDRDITAGTEWEREIDKHLNNAEIILLLISPDFMNSEYCYSIEMKRSLERHKLGDAGIIPVILRPVHWEETPIGKLQALPINGKPITLWPNRDQAFLSVTKGIHERVKALLNQMEQTEKKRAHKDKKENTLPAAKRSLMVPETKTKDIEEVRYVVKQAEVVLDEVREAIRSGALSSPDAESFLRDAENNNIRAHRLLVEVEAAGQHNLNRRLRNHLVVVKDHSLEGDYVDTLFTLEDRSQEIRILELERRIEALQQQINSLLDEKKSR